MQHWNKNAQLKQIVVTWLSNEKNGNKTDRKLQKLIVIESS